MLTNIGYKEKTKKDLKPRYFGIFHFGVFDLLENLKVKKKKKRTLLLLGVPLMLLRRALIFLRAVDASRKMELIKIEKKLLLLDYGEILHGLSLCILLLCAIFVNLLNTLLMN